LYVHKLALYDIIKMNALLCLNALYMLLLKCGLVYFWMRCKWYY